MVTSDEAKVLNEAIFERLACPELNRRAVDAVNDFTRSLMYHKFTGMPKRGYMCRIMPPVTLRSAGEWTALGYPQQHLVCCSLESGLCRLWYDEGSLFYEIAEDRLSREDFEARLRVGRVPRWEWKLRDRSRRSRARREREGHHSNAREVEDFAYTIMGEIVGLFTAAASQRETPGERVAAGGEVGLTTPAAGR